MTSRQLTDSERLIKIEMHVEQISERLRENKELVDERATDHEQRLRRLERWIWVATGAAATAGSAVGTFLGGLPL